MDDRCARLVVAHAIVMLVCGLAQSRTAAAQTQPASVWQYGAFVDVGHLHDFNAPSNHLFRNRGTTPRVDELDVNMTGVALKKQASEASRWGAELTAHAGKDSELFGFSATAPNIGGANWLRHLGPTNVSYLAPIGTGLTVQGGIFNSLIGYDGLYAKDNFTYTRPWGADYTPYLMLGLNASYTVSKNVTATLAMTNGYWHLAHANDVPSVGGQVAYKASDRVTVKETVLYGPHQANTSLEFWRVLSDSVVERKGERVTAAFEFQIGAENVDEPAMPRALWMSAQLPVHWAVQGPWSVTVRPEFAWDRDGRWIGAPQSVKALTTAVEYRVPYRRSQTIVRLEHRYDDSRGPGGGFFDHGEVRLGVVGLTPQQHLLCVAVIVTFDSTSRP
jgi:Putative beta-barrel porin-2, OmpL-like. bbp2